MQITSSAHSSLLPFRLRIVVVAAHRLLAAAVERAEHRSSSPV